MKRRVKYYKRKKNGKTYRQPWIGHSYRRENGTPDFKREISLAGLEPRLVEAIDAALRSGGDFGQLGKVSFLRGMSVGASWAAYCLAEQLGIIEELEVIDERRRLPIVCMILDRVIAAHAHSKLALWESLPGSALERVVAPNGELSKNLHDYYSGLDALHEHQAEIQKALFERRDTTDCSMFLYDITSSYMEGTHYPLSRYGYNRDGKKGKLQIVMGLLTDSEGRPLAVEVFEGNTNDQSTVMSRIDSMREQFGIDEMVFVGDRGMLTRARREDLRADDYEKVKYITALKRREFFQFLEDQDHPLQPGLFDRHKLVEVEADHVRYILSFNPEKEQEDRAVRQRLLERTEEKLEMIRRNVRAGRWKSEKVIAKRLHTWLNKWNMGRFFNYSYGRGTFEFSRNEERIREYEAIDGFYVIVTDTDRSRFDTEEARARYKSLAQVEQAFRTLKTTELFMRPIRHWSPTRVKGHICACMLSYLIVWEARRRLGEFITHDPVRPEEQNNPEEACHSLRTIWETLDREMQIGTIEVGEHLSEHLSAISPKAARILGALEAKPTPKRLERLRLVG